MSEQETREIILPRITKDLDTVFLSPDHQANSTFEEISNVFVFPVSTSDSEEIFHELDYYFEHLNDGRPFFMSCDPACAELMKETVIQGYMKLHPEFFGRMIAVYAQGYSPDAEAGKKKKLPKLAEKGDDFGVIVAASPTDLKEDLDTRLAAWKGRGRIRVPEPVKTLPKLIVKPVTCGPDFVKKKHKGASFLAVALHALAGAFFVISLFHSINTALMNMMLELGNKVSEGLQGLAGTLQGFLENTIIKLISMIPGIGEGLGAALNNASGEGLNHLARYYSLEVSNSLGKLYEGIKLPEGLGFVLALAGSFIASMIMVLVIKIFLKMTSHPMRKKGESLPIAALRSMIAIPILVISAVFAMFSPILGLLIYGLVFIFEMVYIFALLIRSADARSADRLSILFPLFVLIALGVSALAIGIVAVGSGASIYVKASETLSVLMHG